MSAALAIFSRMISISNTYAFSFNVRNRAHFLPTRPLDSTAYCFPPSWVFMARANPEHRPRVTGSTLGPRNFATKGLASFSIEMDSLYLEHPGKGELSPLVSLEK